jgi:hypothetical protein
LIEEILVDEDNPNYSACHEGLITCDGMNLIRQFGQTATGHFE